MMIRETNIKCPICGGTIVCDETAALTSNPIQHRYYCSECGEIDTTAFSDEHLANLFKSVSKVKETDYHAKSDDGKPKLSLVPIKIIFAIEMIRAYGNAKYPDGGVDNWKTVESDRHYEASLRHTAKAWNDPFAIDPESGLPHYFHKLCDDAFFVEQNWDRFMEAIEEAKNDK